MKLLGWMHRKFRQNNNEHLKDFALGNACNCLLGQPSFENNPQFNQKPNNYIKSLSKSQRDNSHLRKAFASLEAAKVEEEEEEELEEEESSAALSELFHGFLAIGTLGVDPIITEPTTPTFSISVENIMEKEDTEVTENELKLINDELEKVLCAENKDDCYNESSRRNSHVSTGRNSHVSAGRTSHVSTITLSGKPMESTENNNGNGTVICPLQGYLLGSAVGILPETTTTAAASKKEHRTTLGELFQKTNLADENGGKYEGGEKRNEEKSAVYLMKKILKRKMLHAPSRNPTAASGGGTADASSAETKLHKILHMFHRKVHPESSSSSSHKSDKQRRNEFKNNINNEGWYNNSSNGNNHAATGENVTAFPLRALTKDHGHRVKSKSNLPQQVVLGSESNGNREYWIRTEADYLVLEL